MHIVCVSVCSCVYVSFACECGPSGRCLFVCCVQDAFEHMLCVSVFLYVCSCVYVHVCFLYLTIPL